MRNLIDPLIGEIDQADCGRVGRSARQTLLPAESLMYRRRSADEARINIRPEGENP